MHPERGNFISGCGRASVRTSIFYFLARDGAASKLIAVKIWESKGMPLRVDLCLADRHFADIPAPARWAKAKQNGYEIVT
jgi:hypothetical protein